MKTSHLFFNALPLFCSARSPLEVGSYGELELNKINLSTI